MSVIPDIKHGPTRTLAVFYRNNLEAMDLIRMLQMNQPNVADLHVYDVSADQWREAVFAVLMDKVEGTEEKLASSMKGHKFSLWVTVALSISYIALLYHLFFID